ncbi:hypothetical protein ACKVEX_15230 [Rhodocyclaceae bacterium SMB388]
MMAEKVGHAEALREWCGDDIGWHYADADNQRLAPLVGILAGVNLVSLDEFIEKLEAEGAPAGDELRERRRDALRLFREQFVGKVGEFDKLNDHAFAGHIEWIMNRKREIERSEAVLPLARLGRNYKITQSNRRKNKPGTDAYVDLHRNERIRAFVKRLRNAHERNYIAQAAEEFDLSPRQIRRITNC